jgi:hypothetical protein
MGLSDLQLKYIEIHRKKRALEKELDDVKQAASDLESTLAELMAANGVQNVSMADGSGLHVRSDRYVNKKAGISQDAVCGVLESLELGYMVALGYNASSLKSRVREWQDAGEEVPTALADLLNIGEVQRVIVTGV